MPSFPAKSTILKMSNTAGRAYFPNFKSNDQKKFQPYENKKIYQAIHGLAETKKIDLHYPIQNK